MKKRTRVVLSLAALIVLAAALVLLRRWGGGGLNVEPHAATEIEKAKAR